jgi:6-phosphogluconolactonase
MDNIHVFENPGLQAIALANKFQDMITRQFKSRNKINIALSGGKTPLLFFDALVQNHGNLPWEKIHIYWVDERCVTPEDRESNYGMTHKSLLIKIDIPQRNIHRIKGELEPDIETIRYSEEIKLQVFFENHWPVFDWILLGLGEDGHTASLFPGSSLLENTHSISAVGIHPQSGQRRITLTLPVLNHGKIITFLVSGQSKAAVLVDLLKPIDDNPGLPAARVNPVGGMLEWYLDRDAAELVI